MLLLFNTCLPGHLNGIQSGLGSHAPAVFDGAGVSIYGVDSACLVSSARKFFKTFSVISLDRKYFWSTCSSKMSDNEYSFSVLRDPKRAVKHLPLQVIPQFI